MTKQDSQVTLWIKSIVALLMLLSSLFYQSELKQWFHPLWSLWIHSDPLHEIHHTKDIQKTDPKIALTRAQARRIQSYFHLYNKITHALVNDELPRIKNNEQVLLKPSTHLDTLDHLSIKDFPASLRPFLKKIQDTYQSLDQSTNLIQARTLYGQLSHALFVVMEYDTQLREGYYSFSCPMVTGFKKWFQKSSEINNPYMGQKMLRCGGISTWESGHKVQQSTVDEIAYWTCSMHPSVQVKDKIPCPLCNMDLLAVSESSIKSATIHVDPVRTQTLGIQTVLVREGDFTRPIRALAELQYRKSHIFDLNIRTEGWIEDLYHWEVGDRVAKGKILLRYYSPQLLGHQQELLVQNKHVLKSSHTRDKIAQQSLKNSITQRLLSLGMSSYLIKTIQKQKKLITRLPLQAPSDGIIIAHHIQQGSHVPAGQSLIQIADDRFLWIEVELFEKDIAHIKLQDPVLIKALHSSLRMIAKVDKIDPYVDPHTRSQKIKIMLDNKSLQWKSGMHVEVVIQPSAQTHLLIPYESWLPTGSHNVVFLAQEKGIFKPVTIDIIDMNQDWIAIKSPKKPQSLKTNKANKTSTENPYQLHVGDRILKSGIFLLASESRLKSALPYWQSQDPNTSYSSPFNHSPFPQKYMNETDATSVSPLPLVSPTHNVSPIKLEE